MGKKIEYSNGEIPILKPIGSYLKNCIIPIIQTTIPEAKKASRSHRLNLKQ